MRDDGEQTRSTEDTSSQDGPIEDVSSEDGSSAEATIDRRDALKLGAAGLGLAVVGTSAGCASEPPVNDSSSSPDLGDAPSELFSAPPIDHVRIGYVGVGLQGSAHVRNLLRIDGCIIQAVCDIVPEKVESIQNQVEQAGFPRPTGYTRGERDFERLCQEEDLDLVYNATPWEWHVPICTSAMENGKHTATEVPAAYTLEDCWKLVEYAEKYQKHCSMMENVNYGRMEMLAFNLVRQGLLGEILHAEGGYLHDLRAIKFEDKDEGLWRRAHAMQRNGNMYPTHGLGPIANCMDINRGDRFATLVSMSSPSRGLQEWAESHYPADHPKRQETYVQGDVSTTMIQTALGRTLYVGHDTNLPRPYSRINQIQGTQGIFQGYPDRVYVEGVSEPHQWDEAEKWLEEYEHPLWKEMEERSQGAGHGGMDFMEDHRLIKCLREGLPTDMNVYDAAALSAVTPLSEWSVANGSQPADFPDFTRGQWRSWPKLGLVTA